MFLLDTDHLVIMQRQTEPEWTLLRSRMAAHDRSEFSLSLVSFHEQVLGANSYISQARNRAEIVRSYQMMELALIDFEQFPVLPFDEPAAIKFDDYRKLGIRIGTMDLRIASIAVSQDCVLLTRNTKDFGKISDLQIEDWTLSA